MSLWRILLLISLFAVIIRGGVCNILALKCCSQGEQLGADLKTCQTSHFVESYQLLDITNNSVTSDVIVQPLANQTVRGGGERIATELQWLPGDLHFDVENIEDSISTNRLFNICSDAQIVRLRVTLDKDRFEWLPNGSLILHSRTAWGNSFAHTFDAQDFCSDTFTDDSGIQQHAILLCPCEAVRCIRKCCPEGEAIVCSNGDCHCELHDVEWQPFHPNLPLQDIDFPYEIVINKEINCPEGYNASSNMFLGFPPFLLKRFWDRYLNGGDMCGDMIVGKMPTPRTGMMRCLRPPVLFQLLDNWLHIPEAIFLFLAVTTSLIVPRRRISPYSYAHDWALIWHAGSLLVRSMIWILYIEYWWSCTILPLVVYFFSVAASFWLNVLCVNMVCGFWKALGAHGSRSGAKTMLFCYSLYAWGATATLTAFTSWMWFSMDVPTGLLRPTLHGTRTCFREEEGDGKVATFAYYYGPECGLLLMNALLFLSTAARVQRLRRHSSVLHRGKAKVKASKQGEQSAVIYIKLLWLMGVMEMAVEVVTWVSSTHVYYNAVLVTGLDNARALAIFVFCVCKWRTLRALRDRLCACAVTRQLRRSQRSTEETDLPEATAAGDESKSASTTDVTSTSAG